VSIFLEFLPRESGRFLLEQLLYVYGLIYKSAVKLKRARRPKKTSHVQHGGMKLAPRLRLLEFLTLVRINLWNNGSHKSRVRPSRI
jgi:hypothetical protein